jgi:hypothetical protein
MLVAVLAACHTERTEPSAVAVAVTAPVEAAPAPAPTVEAPVRITQDELQQLRQCCKRIDAIGAPRGQEGVGLIGVASQCMTLANGVERGAATLGAEDWRAMHASGLDDPAIPASCREMLSKLERR